MPPQKDDITTALVDSKPIILKGFVFVTYREKETWSQSCCPFHDVKVFALPCLSKRATQNPTPMYMYNHNLTSLPTVRV